MNTNILRDTFGSAERFALWAIGLAGFVGCAPLDAASSSDSGISKHVVPETSQSIRIDR